MVSRGITSELLALAIMPAQADTTLTVQGSDGLKSTIQIRNGKGRIGSEGRGEYLLYDNGSGTITYVEPIAQQYTQVTAAELEAMVQVAADIKQSAKKGTDLFLPYT